ncbi:acyltransferase [Streptomyces sp. N2-109]|uniref:Acyltransferase n=1 Tax=Streptomyces gossypii TaxID=2883101 RepID=A0ABT2K4E2_9ACTN|nr:acyltransferase [Streptomyces gossypii]MCT2594484.1 acyltransferase [Streptomyces gossypii]
MSAPPQARPSLPSPNPGPLPEATSGDAAAESAAAARPAHKRLRALDGLRLVAALMVAFYHLGGRNGEISVAWGSSPAQQFPSLHKLFAYGPLGVHIFFIISGFVICMSAWGRGPRAFVASRVSRLLPAYWAAVLLVALVFGLPWVVFETVTPSDLLVNMTMLQQPLGAERVLGVCWTLWVEMRFYVLFLVFVVFPGVTRRRVVIFSGAWLITAVVGEAADWPPLELVVMPEYAPLFIGGMGLYLIHRFGHDATAWGLVVASWLIGQHYAVANLWRPVEEAGFAYRSSAGIIAIVTLGYAVVGAIALGRLQWANWGWLTVAGALTYPFYLVHEHLGWVVVRFLHRGFGMPAWAVLPLTIGGLLVLAWLLHRLVEQRMTPWLKREFTR